MVALVGVAALTLSSLTATLTAAHEEGPPQPAPAPIEQPSSPPPAPPPPPPSANTEQKSGGGASTLSETFTQPSAASVAVADDHGRDEARVSKERDDDKVAKLTKEQRQQKARSNRSGLGDYGTEGQVVGVRCSLATPVPQLARQAVPFDASQAPYVLLANQDGIQQVRLLDEAARQCSSTRVGDYLKADGEKHHEFLFDAQDLTVERSR